MTSLTCHAAGGGEFRDLAPHSIHTAMVSQMRIVIFARWQHECPELAGVDWLKVFCALVGHLRWKFHVDMNQMIPGCGKTVEELAIEVCEQFILREIRWNRPCVPSTDGVIALLKRVIARDFLDAACVRKNGKRVLRKEVALDAVPHFVIPADQTNPERVCIERAGSGSIGRLFESLRERPDHHPKFLSFVRLYLNVPNVKPRDAARELKVSVAVIYQMRKRLERRLLLVVPRSKLEGRPRYHGEKNRRRP